MISMGPRAIGPDHFKVTPLYAPIAYTHLYRVHYYFLIYALNFRTRKAYNNKYVGPWVRFTPEAAVQSFNIISYCARAICTVRFDGVRVPGRVFKPFRKAWGNKYFVNIFVLRFWSAWRVYWWLVSVTKSNAGPLSLFLNNRCYRSHNIGHRQEFRRGVVYVDF